MTKERIITPKLTLLEALKYMDVLDKKLLIIEQNGKFLGLLSVGDIQRAIIQNKKLDTKVSDVLRENYKIAKPEDSFDAIKQMMFEFRMELCPVVNEANEIVKIYLWEELFGEKKLDPSMHFNLPVVIMAGGFGSRLKPLTNVIPKPLIPIGEKTMLEEIIDRFAKYDCNKFFISVNYKSDLIKYYVQSLNLNYQIDFFEEYKPLGTAGSLSLLKGKINETFFVSNCDILVDQDYSEILNYHSENNNEITVVAALKHLQIPYGTIESTENGHLAALVEKPELTIKINSGMYILDSHIIDEVPLNTIYQITDLISKLQQQGRKVGVFPILQSSYLDMGDWNDYMEAVRHYKA